MSRPAYNEDQYGTVIIFRKGVSKEEIAKAMNHLKGLLEEVPAKWSDIVKGYDSRYGRPVWYIP